MKIEIEKVQKIKPFEPFVVKMQFDDLDEAKSFVKWEKDNYKLASHYDEIARQLALKVGNELIEQGFVV